MRCYICNCDQSNISFNALHNDFDPCHTCQEIINDVFGESSPTEIDAEAAKPTPEELLELENHQYELDLDIEEILARDDFS